jgi:FecR protein
MGQQTVFGRLVAVLGLLLPVAWPLCAVAASAPAAALVTIIEGDAVVLRDTARFAAAEGLRLRADDIITTGPAARLVRIELDDGKTLDLGPATQLMLLPRPLAREAGGATTAYLLQGWLKLTVPAKAATPAALATPRLDVVRIGGTLIATVAAEQDTSAAAAARRRLLPAGGQRPGQRQPHAAGRAARPGAAPLPRHAAAAR